MITVQDKIPFFRKIMENEFKLQLDESYRQLEANFEERKAALDGRLAKEMKDRSERQRLMLEEDRRNRLGQAEADLKASLLRQRQQFLDELRQDLTKALKEWLASDDFLSSLQNIRFQRAEGPAHLQEPMLRHYPEVEYTVRMVEGLRLFDDTDRSRIDLSLSRFLERNEKVLSQTFQEMVGAE